MKIASGIFIWNSTERRSRRYGSFWLDPKNLDGDVREPIHYDIPAMKEFVGKRVKLTALVVRSRPSAHHGDLFFSPPVKPIQPEVGDEVEIGVGTFFLEGDDFSPVKLALGLAPSEPRLRLWIDPRVFYRLHDQSVEIHIEETDEADSPYSGLVDSDSNDVISNGDGSFQSIGRQPQSIQPTIERLGEGLFSMTPPNSEGNKGERFKVNY